MKRRLFFKNTLIGGLTLPVLGMQSCNNSPENGPSPTSGLQETPEGFADDFALNEITVSELQAKMEQGALTAREITQMYLDRIEAVDKNGPKLQSVIEINPDALTLASTLDEERKAGKVRGPLHGVPILIKDNIDTGDQMMTTAGALALTGNIAAQDAFIVEKLRAAGAVLLGKTNLSEWANFRSTRSSSGWSGRGGQCKNPFVLDRNPCGSSSGSGAAVSANLCTIAIGTETNGSIVCPSSSNGVVGIKPTVGMWSRSGIIPISYTQDTAGPMTRTVTDAAILLAALSGEDPRDDKTRGLSGKYPSDYTAALDPNGLQGARIGIARFYMGFHEEVDQILEKAFELMRQKGATLIDLEEPEAWKNLGAASYNVLLYEFKDGVNKYLANANAPVKTLEEVIAYNKDNAAASMPYFKQEILEAAQQKGDLNTPDYLEAVRKTVLQSQKGIDQLLQENQLDAILGPTGGPAWTTDLVNGDHFGGGSSSPAAQAGYPNISLPAGYVHGLPVGLSLFGTAFSESTLIRLAFAYEQASQHRKAPGFLKRISY
jgi:amidase